MFENKRNTIGNISGDYNQVIQIILSDGEKIVEKLGTLIERLVNKEKEEINTLKKLITSKEEALGDKTKIVELQGNEIIRLKSDLAQKKTQLEESEKRFSEIFLENNGKNFSGSEEIYPKALEALSKGNKKEALQILERNKMIEQKNKLEKEKEQQAESWLLRADLLKNENNWGNELNECYDLAAEIFPDWGNNLTAANHYKFINVFKKADHYYQICLQKENSDYERASTLNNLANLQRAKNEFSKAEQSYEEALEIRRKLAEENPQTYLPDVGMTLINMAIFYQDSIVKKELSIGLVDEAIACLLPFHHIPYIQDYLKTAFSVLKDWGIDTEKYLKDKIAE